jgi:hypothetical protein
VHRRTGLGHNDLKQQVTLNPTISCASNRNAKCNPEASWPGPKESFTNIKFGTVPGFPLLAEQQFKVDECWLAP